MKDITGIDDILQFILQADDIECDASCGSDMNIPIYEISAEEFLGFAESAIAAGTKEGLINAVSNLKRALDCEMDLFFESINLKKIFSKNNLKFEKKTQFLADIGLFPIQSINKLNLMRNKMEHEYRQPEISDLYAYYELVWSVIKIINLQLELLYINGTINFVIQKGNNEYYFTMEYHVESCRFQFEIKDWTDKKKKEQKQIEIPLKSKDDIDDFIKAFHVFLLSIQYFDYGNVSLYKKNIKKLADGGLAPVR